MEGLDEKFKVERGWSKVRLRDRENLVAGASGRF